VSTEPVTRTDDPGEPDELDEVPAAEARRGLTPVLAAVLAGLLALAIGFAAGFFLGSPSSPGDDSPEAGFARDMSVHHAQAVEMSMLAWQKAHLPEVRTLAYDIATTQQAQIGLMRGWLDKWGLSPSSKRPAMSWMDHAHLGPDGLMPGMATPEEIQQLKVSEGAQVDILFCRLMIDHHMGGVHMAEEVVRGTDDPEVQELAEGMIRAQEMEIKTLKNLLAIAEAGP
jgi:uncharacterized protein (DUF305 family)